MTETIWLQRSGPDVPWGFRLQGGSDNQLPLKVQRVTPGSIAATGLGTEDVIMRIGEADTCSLTYAQAMDAIKNSGNMLQLLVAKKGGRSSISGNAPRRPQPVGRSGPIQTNSPQFAQPAQNTYTPYGAQPAPPSAYPSYHTPPAPAPPAPTPAYSSQRSVPQSPPAMPDAVLNMAARGPPEKKPWSYGDMNSIVEQREKVTRRKNPVSTLPKYMQGLNMPTFDDKVYPTPGAASTPPPSDTAMVTHLQYNSPMDMYSGTNVVESLEGQTDGSVAGIHGLSNKEEKDVTLSPVYRMVHGLDAQKPRHPLATARAAHREDHTYKPVREPAADDEVAFSGISSAAIPSKSFTRLQQMTSPGDIDTTSIRLRTEEDGCEVGNYDEASIRYLGRNIPSKSFRLLQSMTGGDDNVRDQSLERRRQRHAPPPQSPEQNPDDVVDIRFVGSNIPSRSFQRLQNMVPGSPEADPGSAAPTSAHQRPGGEAGSTRTVKIIKLRSQSQTPPPPEASVTDF